MWTCYGRSASLTRYAARVNLIPTRWYTMLVMPSVICPMLITIGLLIAWRSLARGSGPRATRRGLGLIAVGGVMLYLASTPWIATWLSWSLERQTPVVPMGKMPSAGAIVVLGGGQAAFTAPAGEVLLLTHHASDRLERGVEAFKAGKAPLMVMGGGEFRVPGAPLVGEYMREQAVARGVPPERVLATGRVRYTTDEAADIAEMLHDRGVRDILLCTSAYHLPRARRVYEALGLTVVPLPCDFDTAGAGERFSPLLLIPRGLALAQTECCLKEWLGLSAGWLLGFR